MNLNDAKMIIQEHIATLNNLVETFNVPPLPSTLITASSNSTPGSKEAISSILTKDEPWSDEKYLQKIYDACEFIGYALEKDAKILLKEQIVVQCLVNILRQIIQPNYQNKTNDSNNIENTSNINSNAGRYDDLAHKLSNISIDKEGNDATTTTPPVQKSWVFGPKFTPKICFSIIECITFMTEHDEYDEMLLCSDIVNLLSSLGKYAVIERSIESSFNPFPEKIEDLEINTTNVETEDKYLIKTDSLYGILDAIKDLSASDEIESHLVSANAIDIISSLLTYYPVNSEIITVSMLALANLTTNAKLHKNSKSHRACIKPTIQILIHKNSSGKAKECATAVLRNFSADSRTKLHVASHGGIKGLLYILNSYKFNNKKARRQDEEEGDAMKKVESKVSGKQGDKKNLQYLTLVTKRDAIGALRNLSTHDDCDEDIVKHGGIEFFITSMAEIINKYENKNEFRDSLESCISSIRNLCVTEEVALQFLIHPIGLSVLASVVIDDRYPYICRGDAVKAMENLAFFSTIDTINKFVESKAIESLIRILEIDLEDETISESAVITLGYLIVFELGKGEILKLGGRTMVTMLNLNRKQKAEAEKDKRVTTSPAAKNNSSSDNNNGESRRKKKENRLGFGGKSSRFSDAFINDLERRKK
jgi:hypothetical protein